MATGRLSAILKTLNSDNTIVMSGFMIGFLPSFWNKNTYERPLSSLYDSSVSGFFCSIGSSLISVLIPPQFRFVIPATAMFSCVHYIYYENKLKLTDNNPTSRV